MKITTSVLSVLFFLLLFGNNSFAVSKDSVQTISKDNVCKVWVLKEFYENGKKQDLYDYEIEFRQNGTYKETEEGETEKGIWEFNEGLTSFVFDKNTLDQDEWIIVTYETEKLIVKYSDEDKNYKFVLIPFKEK
jgi:hypothetical protein